MTTECSFFCCQALLDEEAHSLFQSLAEMVRPMTDMCLWLATRPLLILLLVVVQELQLVLLYPSSYSENVLLVVTVGTTCPARTAGAAGTGSLRRQPQQEARRHAGTQTSRHAGSQAGSHARKLLVLLVLLVLIVVLVVKLATTCPASAAGAAGTSSLRRQPQHEARRHAGTQTSRQAGRQSGRLARTQTTNYDC